MPKYTLPALQKPEKTAGIMDCESSIETDPWYRKVNIIASKEIVESLTIGEEVDVKLTGKVVGLEAREREGSTDRHEFEIELSSVETYAETELEKFNNSLDEDD